MRIEEYSEEKRASAWKKYEDYRNWLQQGTNKKGEQLATDADTIKESQIKRISDADGCQTCENRKYKDGSNDPGVSFKTPTKLAPEQATSAVRGHEMEHVAREQGKAQREGKEVIDQSVTYHNGICPECGDVYVSGGTTRTTTKTNVEPQELQSNNKQDSSSFEAYA